MTEIPHNQNMPMTTLLKITSKFYEMDTAGTLHRTVEKLTANHVVMPFLALRRPHKHKGYSQFQVDVIIFARVSTLL